MKNATASKRAKGSEQMNKLLKNSSSFHLPKASGTQNQISQSMQD